MALKFLNDGYFAGKVGIGKSVPTKPLDVVGNAQVEGTLTVKTANNNIRLLDSNDNTVNFSVGVNGKFQVRDVNAGTSPFQIEKAAIDNSLYIKANGNVGIGTTSPSRNLQVKGTANTAIAITAPTTGLAQLALGDTDDDNYAQIILDNSTNKLQIQNGGGGIVSNRGITLDSSENVGIGTDSPGSKLEVSSSGAEGILISKDTGTTSNSGRLFFETDTVSEGFSFLNSNGLMTIRSQAQAGATSGNTRVAINGSGNVGIGTTSPSSKLDVRGSANNADIAIRINNTFDDNLATSNPNALLFLNAASNNGYLRVHGAPANTASKHQIDLGSTAASSFLTFSPNGSERMRIDSAGNVGIQNTNPSGNAVGDGGKNLVVGNNANANHSSAISIISGATSGFSYLLFGDGDGAAGYQGQVRYSNADNSLEFVTSQSERLNIGSSGTIKFNAYNSTNKTGTPTYILGTDALGNVVKVLGGDIPGAPGGSGTVNTIPLWTPDGNTLGNSIITQPTSTEVRVAGKLKVSSTVTGYGSTKIQTGGFGDSQSGINILNSTTGYGYILFGDGSGADLYRGQISYKHGDDFMAFNTAGSQRMTINSSGNVGIGTTSPTTKLNVSGSIAVSSGSYLSFIDSNLNYNKIGRNTSVGGIQITTGGNATMNLLDNGNVGIGTTSPGATLYVKNTVGSWPFIVETPYDRVGKFISTDSGAEIIIQDNSSTDNGNSISVSGDTMGLNTAGSNRIKILANGNVGIGTTSPDAKLVVEDDSNVVYDDSAYQKTFRIEKKNNQGNNQFANIRFNVTGYEGQTTAEASIGVVQTSNASSGNLVFGTRNNGTRSEKMRITSAGNVGIGDTTPLSKLEVAGSIKSTNYDTSHTSESGVTLGYNATEAMAYLETWTSKPLTIRTYNYQAFNISGNEAMRITSAGNVGIGTTTPTAPLHIEGGTNSEVLKIEADSNPFVRWVENGTDVGFLQFTGGTAYLSNMGNGSLQFRTNNTTKMLITSGGDVGIGTTNPLYKIHSSNSGSRNDLQFTLDSFGTGSTDGAQLGIQAGGAYIWNFENNDLYFATNNSRVLTIKPSGNVGIGTTSPDTKLDIEDSNPFVTIQGSSSSFVNAGVQFISNQASTTRGLGNFYYSAHSDVEWFSGLPYGGNDAFVINRNTSYTVPSSQSSPPGIGASAGTLLKVDSAGAIRFNNYSGTNKTGTATYLLGTDANGNVVKTTTVPSGSGGPYLPLTAGSSFPLTSGLYIPSYIYHVGDTNTLFGFGGQDLFIINTGGGRRLTVTNTEATFGGDVVVDGGELKVKGNFAKILLEDTAGTDLDAYIVNNANGLFFGKTNSPSASNDILSLNLSTKAATFASSVTIPNYIYHAGDPNTFFGFDGNDQIAIKTSGNYNFFGDSTATTLYAAGNAKLKTTIVSVGTATTAGGTLIDGWKTTTQANAINDTTIATTAYVNNKIALIPAGLVFQGTWNAATNTPTLTSGSGTTGNFYIVSTPGNTNLDGITDWKTGDWAVFIEQGASDQWEKIDNSSVLDGFGTGGSVAGWAGSGTSNTLTNAPITFSGNNSTFAGNVAVSGTSSTFNTGNSGTFVTNDANNYPRLTMTNASAQLGLFRAGGNSGGMYIGAAGDGFRLYTTSFAQKLLVDQSGNATFAGNISAQDLLLPDGADVAWDGGYASSKPVLAANGTTMKMYPSGVTSGVQFQLTPTIATFGGNVGIGTTTPGSRLHVVQTGNAPYTTLITQDNARKIKIGRDSIQSTDLSDVAANLYLNQAGANVIVPNSNTSFGINTTSPQSKLHVVGGIQMADDTATASASKVGTMRYRTATNEPVPVTGTDLVINGDFSNGTTGWTFGTGWAVSNGGATVSTAGVTTDIRQAISYVANISTATKFRYRFEITDITAGSLRLFVAKPTFTQIANVNAVGVYEYVVEVSTGSNGVFYLYSTSSSGSTFQGTVTNVSVLEVTEEDASYADMCMQTGASTYEWVNIVRNTY